MRVLSMDIDQSFRHLTQLLNRDCRPIEIGARTPVSIEHTTQDQAIVFDVDILLTKPAGNGLGIAQIKLGTHFGALTSATDQPGIGAFSKNERQRVDQNRLACPGFTGQRAKALSEFKLKPVHQNKIANGQATQHRQARPFADC